MFEFFNQDAIREQRDNAAVKVQAAARRFLAVRREAGRAAAAAVIQRSVRERQGLMRKDTEEVPCRRRGAAADLDEDELAALALPHVKRQFVLLVLIALVGLVVGGGAGGVAADGDRAAADAKSSPMMVSKRSTPPPRPAGQALRGPPRPAARQEREQEQARPRAGLEAEGGGGADLDAAQRLVALTYIFLNGARRPLSSCPAARSTAGADLPEARARGGVPMPKPKRGPSASSRSPRRACSRT